MKITSPSGGMLQQRHSEAWKQSVILIPCCALQNSAGLGPCFFGQIRYYCPPHALPSGHTGLLSTLHKAPTSGPWRLLAPSSEAFAARTPSGLGPTPLSRRAPGSTPGRSVTRSPSPASTSCSSEHRLPRLCADCVPNSGGDGDSAALITFGA